MEPLRNDFRETYKPSPDPVHKHSLKDSGIINTMDPTKQQRRLFYKGLLAGNPPEPVNVAKEEECLLALIGSRKCAEYGFEFLRSSDFTGPERKGKFRAWRMAWRKHKLDVPDGSCPREFLDLCRVIRSLTVRRWIRTLSWRYVGAAYFGQPEEWAKLVERTSGELRKRLLD